eukprot:6832810-Karenia_brevis.AAC.1
MMMMLASEISWPYLAVLWPLLFSCAHASGPHSCQRPDKALYHCAPWSRLPPASRSSLSSSSSSSS